MSIFNFLRPFVSEYYFEKQKLSLKYGVNRFLSLVRNYDHHLHDLRQVEFFFYSKTIGNATDLKNDLIELGYEVYGIASSSNNEYSIIGVTNPISIRDKDFMQWTEKMNEIGFINDCRFDGWGMLTSFDK